MASCAVCGGAADPAYSLQHRLCGHSTHADCLPRGEGAKPNFKFCNACDAEASGDANASVGTSEPHTNDGIEYWRNPGAPPVAASSASGLLSAVFSPFKRAPVAAGAANIKAKETPLELLKRRLPLRQIMQLHGYGLDHMLRLGVTMDDFLANGYKWSDLCEFEYISKDGPFRCLETLHRGLGLTANHLRDNPDRLPIAAIKAQTDMPTSDFAKRFGLEFAPNGPLQCNGDDNWNALHCVALGLTMEDLIDFGLYRIEQYRDLMRGLTSKERARAERELGVTAEHLESLQEAEPLEASEPIQEEPPSPIPSPPRAKKLPQRKPARVVEIEEEVEDEEEEEEEEEEAEERSASPPRPKAAVAKAKKPVLSRAEERYKLHGYVGRKPK